MRRPSVFVIGAFWSGLALAGSIPLDVRTVAMLLALAVVLMLGARRARTASVLFLSCIFLLGCLRSPEARRNDAGWNRPAGQSGTFPCVIEVSGPPLLGLWAEPVKVRVESVLVGYGWLEARHVFLRGPGALRAGYSGGGTVSGTFHVPRPRLNPYGWDAALRYRREGVAGTVMVRSFAGDSTSGRPLLFRLRDRVRNLVASAGTDRTRGVLGALLLGERSDLRPEVKETMVRAGTYHVIAISGLHVGIVVLLVTSLVTMAGPPRGLRIVLAVFFVFAYVLWTGARPSAQRAGALFLMLSLVRYLQWKVDVPNCVCAAGALLLAAFPHLAWDVGFRLSLAAVFGITLFVPQLSGSSKGGGRSWRPAEYVRLGLLASFTAQIATLPILLYHFGRVSLLGMVCNLMVLPLVTLTVAAGLEASIAVILWNRLGLVFMRGASTLAASTIAVTSLVSRHVDLVVFTGRPHLLKLIVYACALGYIGLANPRCRRRWKMAALVALYALLVVPLPAARRPGMVATFIHVGDGDACLVESPRGRAMLIDTGAGGEGYDAGRLDVLPLLAMKGLKRLDTVIITHSHNDHYGGLGALIGNVDIDRVVVGASEGEAGYLAALAGCRDHGIAVDLVGRGDTLTWEGARIEIMHPPPAPPGEGGDDPNAESVVFKLSYGKTGFLFTGDLPASIQRQLHGLGFDLTCDVLKVPHHGAPDGVDPVVLEACGARYAVISAGSRFASHPCPEVVRLLERSGARTLVTKNHGAVTVVTDGESLRVRAEGPEAVGAALQGP